MASAPEHDPRIYAHLDDLARLEYKARGFSFLPRQPMQSLLAGRYASRLRGRGLNFEEIREYLPGDDIRNMDWKVTARLRKPHVRVYTEERDRPLLLVVDQRLSMFFGSRRNMNSVTAAEIAAIGAWRSLGQGDRVGGIVFNDERLMEFKPHRSRIAVLRLLGAVSKMNLELRADSPRKPNRDMLMQALGRAIQLARHDYLVCVISTFWGADDREYQRMKRLAAHNDVIAAHIYDEAQLHLPAAGKIVISDGDLQFELDTDQDKSRRGLADYFESRTRQIKESLRKIGVPTLLISNAKDSAAQLRSQLGLTGQAPR